jgi:hypothetical protein
VLAEKSFPAKDRSGCGAEDGKGINLWPVFFALLAICALALAALRTYNILQYNRRPVRRGHRRRKRNIDPMTWGLYALGGVAFLLMLIISAASGKTPDSGNSSNSTTESTAPPVYFQAEKTEVSDPDKWSVRWEIFKNGSLVHSYDRENPIYFSDPEDYFALPGIAVLANNRRHVYYAAPALLCHHRHHGAGEVECRFQVCGDYCIPLLFSHSQNESVLCYAGIVHQYVNASEVGNNIFHNGFGYSKVGCIGSIALALYAKCLNLLYEFLGVAVYLSVRECNVCTLLCKFHRNGTADASCRSCNKRCLSFK